MRHRKKHTSNFGLKSGPHKALMKGLVRSLVKYERIRTTLPKAKALRPLVEKAVTVGRRGDVSVRRLLFSRYPDKETVSKIIKLSERFKDRPGGYTRIVRLGRRAGDQASRALIEFVDYQFTPAPTDEEKAKHKASKEYKKSRRLLVKKAEAARRAHRKKQAESRRINR
ncbi:MAG: 50S ribosomal protein L17 [Bdellovibrionales bacterium]|nr:50S ribosomal protein L17 [Bdellovibrionales bacterium]